jgi:ribosomal protein S18 acetylase RimI-like enzyme
MCTSIAIALMPPSASTATRDTLFSLYSLSLRQFIQPIYGWDETFQKQRFVSEYPEENTKIVLAGEAFAGYVVVAERPDVHHVALLILRPEFQRIGIGQEVMNTVVAEARAAGKAVTLSCFKSNKAAFFFYQLLGFVVQHEEPSFFLLTNAA